MRKYSYFKKNKRRYILNLRLYVDIHVNIRKTKENIFNLRLYADIYMNIEKSKRRYILNLRLLYVAICVYMCTCIGL